MERGGEETSPGGAARAATRRAQHRDLLDPHRASRASPGSGARSSPRASSAPAGPPRRSRSPTRSRTSSPTCSPRPRCRPRSCRSSPTAPAGAPARGVPAGLDAVLDHADRARRDHGVLRARRRGDHAAVHRARRSAARWTPSPSGSRRCCSRSCCCSGSPACSSGSCSPTNTSRSPRSRRGVERRDHRRCSSCCARTSTAEDEHLRVRDRRSCSPPACSSRWRSGRSRASTSACSSDRLARPPHPPGVRADAARHDRPRIINLDQLINAAFGTLVSNDAPRAIENAFRIYMLPQGIFSVAVATVLFPTLSRMAARRDPGGDAPRAGNRDAPDQPAADPRRGVHDRARDADRAAALRTRRLQRRIDPPRLDRAVLVRVRLPFGGLNLLLTRTFFAVQRPWIPTSLAAMNMVVDIVVSRRALQAAGHRRPDHRHRRRQRGDDRAAGLPPADRLQRPPRGAPDDDDHRAHRRRLRAARRPSRGSSGTCSTRCSAARCPRRSSASAAAGAAGVLVYMRAVLAMRIPEAHQVRRLIRAQLAGLAAAGVQRPRRPCLAVLEATGRARGPPGSPGQRSPLELLRPRTSCLRLGGMTLPTTGTGRRSEGRRVAAVCDPPKGPD